MLQFETSLFAIAGLMAAAGPLIIHLLNRRNFRIVEWGAMAFLRQALERNRRMLELRDFLLLVLRGVAVILLGLAFARPFFSGGGGLAVLSTGLLAALLLSLVCCGALAITSRNDVTRSQAKLGSGVLLAACLVGLCWPYRNVQGSGQAGSLTEPVHAVVVIDNSRSMGRRIGAKSLFELATDRAANFVERLPAGSRVTVLPVCGGNEPATQDAWRSLDEARRAIKRIPLTDRTANINMACERASAACAQVKDLPIKRVAILSDLQEANWPVDQLPKWFGSLEDCQIVPIGVGESTENVALNEIRCPDGVASSESAAGVVVQLASYSADPVTAQVRLLVNGSEVGSQTIELAGQGAREIEFVDAFRFLESRSTGPQAGSQAGGSRAIVAAADEADRFARVSAKLSIVGTRSEVASNRSEITDGLTADNELQLLVPVAERVPIVFIDEWGTEERIADGRIGETYALRHLLSPRQKKQDSSARNQTAIEERHVRVDELTEEILRDARLVVMAGVSDPGEGVPLLRDYVLQGGPLMIFAGGEFDPRNWNQGAWLDGAGILPCPLGSEEVGQLPEDGADKLRPFGLDFRSMQHDYFLVENEDKQQLQSLYETVIFFKAVPAQVDDLDPKGLANATWPQGKLRWWEWSRSLADRPAVDAKAGEPEQPRMPLVLARFGLDDLPYVVERPLGAGRVLLFTSGISSNWNLLRSSPGIAMLHRICGKLLEETYDQRNFAAGDAIRFPIEKPRGTSLTLVGPTGERSPVNVEAIAEGAFGIDLRQPGVAGLYQVVKEAATGAAAGPANRDSASAGGSPVLTFAIQGEAGESNLQQVPVSRVASAVSGLPVAVLSSDEEIRLTGGGKQGARLWQGVLATMLGVLLCEGLVLAQGSFRAGGA